MEDNIQSVYNKFVSFGYEGTEDDFRNYISDDANIPNVYKKLASFGYEGTEDDFRGYIGRPKQDGAAPARVDVSDVEQAEQTGTPVAQQNEIPTVTMEQLDGAGHYRPRSGGEPLKTPEQLEEEVRQQVEANRQQQVAQQPVEETGEQRMARMHRAGRPDWSGIQQQQYEQMAAETNARYGIPNELNMENFNQVSQRLDALNKEADRIEQRQSIYIDDDVEPSWVERDQRRMAELKGERDALRAYVTAYGRTDERQDFEQRLGSVLDQIDQENTAQQAWNHAEELTRAEQNVRNEQIWNNYAAMGGGREMRIMATGETYNANASARMKYHDLQRMADEAWDMLGSEKQQAIVGEIYNILKDFYPDAEESALRENAERMARQQSDRRVYDLAVENNTPKNTADYFFRKVVGANSVVMMMEALARSSAGTTGDLQAREEAERNFDQGWNKVAGIGGTVVGLAADPLMWMSGGAGGAAERGFLYGMGKYAGEAATRRFATTLGGRMAVGAVRGGASFGTYEAGKETLNQLRWGGEITGADPETGLYVIGDYNGKQILGSFGHGVLMGGVTGVIAPGLGNVSDNLVRATESTVGKAGIRTGELAVGTVAEGTVFAAPEFINTYLEYSDLISSLSDENSPNYIADENERAQAVDRLLRQRKGTMMDVWTDNMAMVAGFKAQHVIKSIPTRIAELQANPNSKAGFETRLRSVLDGNRRDLALTKEEKMELEAKGYNDLEGLVSSLDGIRNSTGLVKDGQLPYNRFLELMQDKDISESARAKMYYYLTGNVLPMSTVIGGRVSQIVDDNGNTTGWLVQSFGQNGVITNRMFNSEKAARAEESRIFRQTELNMAEIGERKFDQGKKEGELTSDAVRKAIFRKYFVDVDQAIKKEPGRRSKMEQEAVQEYLNTLWADEINEADQAKRDAERQAWDAYREEQRRREEVKKLKDASEQLAQDLSNEDDPNVLRDAGRDMRDARRKLAEHIGEDRMTALEGMDDEALANAYATADPETQRLIKQWLLNSGTTSVDDGISQRSLSVIGGFKENIIKYFNNSIESGEQQRKDIADGIITVVEWKGQPFVVLGESGSMYTVRDVNGNAMILGKNQFDNERKMSLDEFVLQQNAPELSRYAALAEAFNGTDFAIGQTVAIKDGNMGKNVTILQIEGDKVTYTDDYKMGKDGVPEWSQESVHTITKQGLRDLSEQWQVQARREEAMQQTLAETSVGDMKDGDVFLVQWNDKVATAKIEGVTDDGMHIVSVYDTEGSPMQTSIDDVSDEDWEAMRVTSTDPSLEEGGVPSVPVSQDGTDGTDGTNGTDNSVLRPDMPTGLREGEENVQPQPEPQAPKPIELPRDKDGNIDHSRLDPQNTEAYNAAVNEEADNAVAFTALGDAGYLNRNIDAAKKGLEKAEKTTPKSTGAAQLKAELADFNAKKQAARNLVDFWENVRKELERRTSPDPSLEEGKEQPVEETPVEETPAEETSTEEVVTPPAPLSEGETDQPMDEEPLPLSQIEAMSDEELLQVMSKDGKGDINKALNVDVYDEYDSRHNDDFLRFYDEAVEEISKIESQLEDGNSEKNDGLIQQISDIYTKADEEWDNGGSYSEQRTKLSARLAAAEEWLDKNVRGEVEHGPTDGAVAAANEEVDTNPTEAQKEAGNYKKGHVTIDGFDISIENPAGSTRSGTDAQGNPWSVTMHNSYGYIRMTEGVDGDHIDIFLSDHIDDWNGTVYVVDQVNEDGSFDEHKVMYGFNSAEEAREAYLSNYSEGWQGLGTITGVSREEFKKWVDSSHRKTKPFTEYKSVQTTEGQNEAMNTQPTEQPVQPKKEKKESEFQKRITAVGEPRTLEEAILYDIAVGGAKFRWGNRNEDKAVVKRGIGDLWKYSNSEYKKRIGIVKKDGYSIETYAEAILAGQLQPYSGAVSQIAERMDMHDIIGTIEDVLQMVTSRSGALQAIEEKRLAEAEEEENYIRSLKDAYAKELGFKDFDEIEEYYTERVGEGKDLTDDEYYEISRIFAEQYGDSVINKEDGQESREGLDRPADSETGTNEQSGVRGEGEGGNSLLQSQQTPSDEGREQPGQETGGLQGNPHDGTAQEPSGAAEVRDEINKLKAKRADIIRQRDDIQQRYEKANGLFGDMGVGENSIQFEEGQNFLAPDLAQTTIDGYNNKIKKIDEEIKRLEASLERAKEVTQTEIGGEENKTDRTDETDKQPTKPESREELDRRLKEERKQRILKEGTSFDQPFGLVPVSETMTAEDIEANVGRIVQGLKDNEGSGNLDQFYGYAYQGAFGVNAGEQVKDYIDSLYGVVPMETLKAWYDSIGLKTYGDLVKYGKELYDNTQKTEQNPVPQPEKKEEKKPEKLASRKIDDVGEKIEGARKDLAKKLSTKIDLEAETFPKMFPKFDLKKLVGQGLDPKLASAVMFLRQAAYADYKRDLKHKRKEHALGGSRFMAAYAKHILENADTDVEFTDNRWVFTDYGKIFVKTNIALYEKIHEKMGDDMFGVDLSDYKIDPINTDGKLNCTVFRRNENGEEERFTPYYQARAKSGTFYFKEDELDKAIDLVLGKIERGVSYEKSHPFKLNVYYTRGTSNQFYVGVKIGGEVEKLTENFSTSNEALAYLNEHNAELQEKSARLSEQRKEEKKQEKPVAKVEIIQADKSKGYSGGYVFAVKLGKEYVRIMEDVYALPAIYRYEKEHRDELQQMAQQKLDQYLEDVEKGKGWKPQLNLGGGRTRVGEDYRQGRDVSGDEFREAFGFRGVQFGNYVTQKERQRFLNEAYDSLMDLADLIGVSPKALSLGGQLGFAIGARGGGGSNAAHYEPGENVINLTKTQGAGSLAHEWWHALDYYFNREGENRRKSATAVKEAGDFSEGVRKEMRDAFLGLMERINNSDYFTRSKALERRLHPSSVGTGYYDKPTELGARAFQDYVSRRLTERGQVNDFLSSFTPEEQWNGEAKTYPYPTGEDATAIDERFDKLFGTMEERQDEQGNAILYHKVGEEVVRDEKEIELMQGLVEWEKSFLGDDSVITDSEEAQRVLDEANGKIREQRVYHGTGADFDRFDFNHMGEGEGAQAYGWGGYVTEVEGIGKKYAESIGGTDEQIERSINVIQSQMFRDELHLKNAKNDMERRYYEDAIEVAKMRIEELRHARKLYTVEIPNDSGSNYLEWDKPVTDKQAERIKQALLSNDKFQQHSKEQYDYMKSMLGDTQEIPPFEEWTDEHAGVIAMSAKESGERVYRNISNAIGGDKQASEFLHNMGYVGIKYPAEYRTGGRKDKASNYTIFNEGDMKITDKVKFFRTPSGEAYGFTVGGKVYIDPRIATAETPIHEYAHLYGEAIRRANPEAWEHLKQDLLGHKDVLDYVKGLYPKLEGDELLDEVWAHFSGKRGAEYMRSEQKRMMDEAEGFEGVSRVAAIFDRIRKALKKFWNMARDLFAGKNEKLKDMKAEDFADMMMNDFANKFDPRTVKGKDGAKPQSDEVKYSMIGRQGAQRLDIKERAMTRLNNLHTAREMEQQGKDAKAIRLATGWERGKDGKWRFEIPDYYKAEEGIEALRKKTSATRKKLIAEKNKALKKYYQADERYKDFGEKYKDVDFSSMPKDDVEKIATISLELGAEREKYLNEYKEKDKELTATYEDMTVKLSELVGEDSPVFTAYPQLKDINVVFKALGNRVAGSYNTETNTITINGIVEDSKLNEIVAHEVQHAIQGIEGFAQGTNIADTKAQTLYKQQQVEKISKQIEELEKQLPGMTEPWTEEHDKIMEQIEKLRDEQLNIRYNMDVSREAYRSAAGEVEARNVEKRLNMTDDERREALLADTEDVAREDQIVLMEGSEAENISMLAENSGVSEQQLSLFLQNNSGEYETQDGEKIGYTSLLGVSESISDGGANATDVRGRNGVERESDLPAYKLRSLEPGETCHVERRYQKSKMFDFTGSDKIETADDVAYIFRKLEDAAVENSFVVLMKDGKPTIIHTGIGGYASTTVNIGSAIVAYNNLNPDAVWFVHNHPSGSITSSRQDRDIAKKFRDLFGDKFQGGIIIDVTSGQYGLFDEYADNTGGRTDIAPKKEGDIDVYEFSKQVFEKDWNPQTAFKVRSSEDVAKFISSHRLGEHDKMSLLIINANGNVVGNVFLPYTNIGEANTKELADLALYYMNQMAGTRLVVYGSFTLDDEHSIRKIKERINSADATLLDVISTNKTYTSYRSAANMSMLSEEEQQYESTAHDSIEPVSEEELNSYDSGRMSHGDIVANTLVELANKNKENVQRRIDAVRALGNSLQKVRQAMAAQRAYDKTTVDQIVRLAQIMMKGGMFKDFSNYEVRRLLSMAKNANGRNDISKQANAVVGLMLDHALKEAESILEGQMKVKGSKVGTNGVEVQGKLDITGQRMMAALKDGMELDPEALEERIADAIDRMGSDNKAVADNAALEHQGLMLAKQYHDDITQSEAEESNLRNELKKAKEDIDAGTMTREQYKEFEKATQSAILKNKANRIGAYINMVNSLGSDLRDFMGRAKAFREREEQRIKEIQHNANSDMQGKPASEHSKTTRAQRVVNSSLVRFFMKPVATFDEMLRFFGSKSVDGQGYLWNRFMGGFVDAADNEWRNLKKDHDELDAKVSEVMGEKMRWSDLFAMERKMKPVVVKFMDGGVMKEHELSQGNALYIYMVNKMEDGQMKLRRMGITEDDVEKITNQLNPKFKELADWMQDVYLPKKREDFNAVHERMFGAPMAAIEDYFPLVINSRSRGQEEDISNPNLGETKPSTITGSIIKRTANATPLDLTNADAFDVLLGHLRDMEHWAAYAELNRDMNTLLSYKHFKNQVLNTTSVRFGGGETLWKNFKDVCAIAADVYHPRVDRNSLDNAMVNISKGVTSAKISFRLFTAFKQLLSYPAYFSEANAVELVKSTVKPAAAFNWALDELPGFAERWQSRQAGDSRLKDTDADWDFWRNKIVDTARRWGMTPNAFVDGLTVAMGAKAIYESKLKRYKADGYSEEEAKQKALKEASIAYNETQQSNQNAYLSAMQLDRTVASVALTVFRNASMGYQRRMLRAIDNIRRKFMEGYKEESIAFMAKQGVRSGLSEEQAQEAAEKAWRRSIYKDIANVVIFGYIMQLAWNLGAYLPYLIFGDDDNKKKELLKDAFLHAFAGPIEGLTGGSVISELYNMARSGKDISNYSFNLLPIMSDIQNTLKHFKQDDVRGWNDVVNLLIQAGVGVNPQTISDAAVAIVDATNGDLGTAKEIGFLLLRMSQVPQSQLDQLYIDELGMSAKDAKGLDYETLAKRYAEYKANRDAPLTGWLYSDESRQKAEQRYMNRFQKMIQERIAEMDEDDLDRNMDGDNVELKRLLGKEIASRLEGKDTEGNKPSSNWKEETQRAHLAYQRNRDYIDVVEDVLMRKAQTDADAEYEAALAEGDYTRAAQASARANAIEKARKQIGKMKASLGLADGQYDAQIMENIRKARKQYMQAYGIR